MMRIHQNFFGCAGLLVMGAAALVLSGCSAQGPASASKDEGQAAAFNAESQAQPAAGAGSQAPSAATPDTPATPEEDAKAVSEFNNRVAEYVKLHRSLESTAGVPAKAEPEVVAAHQKQLAAALQAARQGARPGDIFGSAEPYLRRMIAAELRKDSDAKDTVLTDGNPRSESPTEAVTLAVNAVYPEQAPVSTVPPSLLLRLPPLPEEFNYRFVGRHLILHDIHANLIVDYLPNVVP